MMDTLVILAMGISGDLRKLARFLDECEENRRVRSVELVEDTSSESGELLTADIEMTVSICPIEEATASLCDMNIDADGVLRFELESSRAIVPTTPGVTVEPTHATFDADGVTLTLSASVSSTESSISQSDEKTNESAGVTDETDDSAATQHDRDLPPFRDPAFLAEVYESCETFTEMPDMLGMDVTAETVRRYMIDYGIHEPDSYDTPTDDTPSVDPEDEPPVVLADGIGLPDDVTVDTIIDVVQRSNTIYEVTRDIGIERENTLEMLQELNLLDLVVGRLATEKERAISREDVIERLRDKAETDIY
jgi:hypothetical protein